MKRRTPRTAAIAADATPAPRYHHVYVALRNWLRDGRYRPGQQIPTEPELCEAFGVSRITVRKAVDALVAEHWLTRRQGKGTYVAERASAPASTADLGELRRRVSRLGRTTTVSGLVVERVTADDETLAALKLSPGALVEKAVHIRRRDNEPIGLITTWVPLDVADRLSRVEQAGKPLLELLGHHGIRVASAEQYLGATLADLETARALKVPVGGPLLRIERVVCTTRARPVERVVALWRADAYEYRMRLQQRRGGSSSWTIE